MPLADTGTVTSMMDNAIQNITNNLPTTEDGVAAWDAAAQWAPVATAFFSNMAVPSVTPLGVVAGEAAFITAAKETVGSDNSMSDAGLAAGFKAYADALVAVPANIMPIPPITHTSPTTSPEINLSAVAPSETTLPATTILYNQLLPWAVTGIQTTPGAPPVVAPWT